MISKTLLNNVKQYKRRDASMDNQQVKGVKNCGVKLPMINDNKNGEQHQGKFVKSKCVPLEAIKHKRASSKVASLDSNSI